MAAEGTSVFILKAVGCMGGGRLISSLPFFLGLGDLQEEAGREADIVIQQEVATAGARSGSGQRDMIKFKIYFQERGRDSE